ncbi:MAG: hypothetical protein U5K33_08010 [Halofilum sp. (in: g-proteobacteria)]|nr:hypothetical protein [Halofilum sp. (in: g-proteobacteria)]
MKYLVCNGLDDDGLDIDEGYQGNIQFAIVRQGASNGDRGIESDGNGSNFGATPRTAPNIANLTVLGNAGKGSAATVGAVHREGFAGKVYRSVYTDDVLAGTAFDDGCLDVDDTEEPQLEYLDMVFNCTPGNTATADD